MIIKILFFIYIVLSAVLVLKNYNLSKFLLFLIILLLTPWFVIFLKTQTQFWWLDNPFGNSLTVNVSSDYLFFQGSENIRYSIQEAGYFYLWQLPFIVLGLYFGKYFIVWFLGGLLFASVFSLPTFSASLLYFVPLQLIFFAGLNAFLKTWKKFKNYQKALAILYFVFALYEIAVFFHILFIHWPKKLLIG